ncbi:hypothetical protein C8R41DRAFT_780200 [Lentinula lateritia]|uniref:C2H2-type domain-containing protein n=1 Tax=Lentinula lateritia TaxID=40482 RepID=A0ABQ8UZB3_9AGAR|nr:hypothetical protein C8R41DRAFT_780200 [Lentinula lateritia]
MSAYSTGGDDITGQNEGESYSQYAKYEGSWPSYPQASGVGETTAPKQGRPPARGRYANNTEVRVVSGGIKKATGDRRYVCTAPECGKCFVRGEHLKRHVRSLHSWEKPHKCLHPGCNKSFSRRDNLGQHARVHL